MNRLMIRTALAAPLLFAAPFMARPAQAQAQMSAAPANSALPPAAPPKAEVGPTPPANSNALPHAGTTTLSAVDQAFVQKAAQGGIAEVQLAQTAQQKTQSEQVKQFAQKMIDDHTPNNEQLVKLATTLGVTPPTEPDAMQQKMALRLETMSGSKFDRAYIHGQIQAHETMLKLFRNEAAHGQDPQLKSFAEQTVPVIQEHLSMAQQLRKAGA